MYKIIWIPWVLAGIIWFTLSLQNGEERLFKDRERAEKNTPPFNPEYFKEKEKKHIAVFLEIFQDTLTPSSRSAEIRPGNLPFRSKSMGPVTIIYKGANGQEIGRYAIEDPLIIRSSDIKDTKPIRRSTIEILLPLNLTIRTIEIGSVEGLLREFDISKQIENLTK